MRALRWLALLMCGLMLSGGVVAQDSTCPALVEQALQATNQVCSDLGRNQICYGNIKAEAYDTSGKAVSFEQAGDRIPVQGVSKLITFPLNVTDKTWGVAMLSLQANLPDTLPGQNVTLVAFGDASLENEVKADAPPAPSLVGTATGKINVRSGPGTSFDLVGTVAKDDSVTAVGRSEKGDWVQVLFDNGPAWVFTSLLKFTGDTSILLPTNGEIPYNAPMQAFRFRTNAAGMKCDEAPQDGLLIQSPQHVTVNFRVNGIDIKIGSTAVIRNTTNDALRILNLDGAVVPSTANSGVPLQPGQVVEVSDGNAPGIVDVYNAEDVRALPLGLLPDTITLPPVISNIQSFNVVGDGSANLFPITFLNGDGDALVEFHQTLVSATGGNWFSGTIPVSSADYADPAGGTLNYYFSCNTSDSVTVTYQLELVDAAGNVSPPARYTATCSPA